MTTFNSAAYAQEPIAVLGTMNGISSQIAVKELLTLVLWENITLGHKTVAYTIAIIATVVPVNTMITTEASVYQHTKAVVTVNTMIVITSYSIHYTKLYELSRSIAFWV